MKLVIKFPTRNRPQKFTETFLKYQYMLSQKHDVKFLVSMDCDDETMNTDTRRKFFEKFANNTSYYYGHSTTKIEAVNADIEHLPTDFDILLLASDDMIPVEPSYDDIICTDMMKFFPNMDGVLHYNDGRLGEKLNTLSIMGRRYFDRFRYIYYPGYKSVFCDNEFMDVSRLLKKAQYIDRVIIRHGWVQYVGFDALARRNENPVFYDIDGALYRSRLAMNFGL